MTRRSRVTASATCLFPLAAALGLVGLALAYDGLAGAADSSGFAAFAIPLAAMALLTGSVGLLIRLRRPDNRVGMLMTLGSMSRHPDSVSIPGRPATRLGPSTP